MVETILPGQYPSRPVRHIHFKVWRPDGTEALTSQLYFDGPDYNPDAHPGPLVPLGPGAHAAHDHRNTRPPPPATSGSRVSEASSTSATC